MTEQEYTEGVLKTEAVNFSEIRERFTDENIRLLHAAMGMATEAAEILDAVKKHIFYGKKLDILNLKEELGDSKWYSTILIDVLRSSVEEINEINQRKLFARYKNKAFSSEEAINRDVQKEQIEMDFGT